MIILGLGANLPGKYISPEDALKASADALSSIREIRLLKASSVWLSAPVPISDQPWYANAVCTIETRLKPKELLEMLHNTEASFGRIRSTKNAPRELDIDLLAYNEQTSNERPQIPHPRMHQRAFVLYPLQEIAPNWRHPVLKQSVSELIEKIPAGQEIRKSGPLLKTQETAA